MSVYDYITKDVMLKSPLDASSILSLADGNQLREQLKGDDYVIKR